MGRSKTKKSKPMLYYRLTAPTWHWVELENGKPKRAYVNRAQYVLVHIPEDEKQALLTFNRLVLELTGKTPNEVFDKSVGLARISFEVWLKLKNFFHFLEMDDAKFYTERF